MIKAKKVLLTILGQKRQISLKLPDYHPVELKQLTTGPVTELPLHDPLTMKPMTAADKASAN